MINIVKGCKRLIYFSSFLVDYNKIIINNRRPLLFFTKSLQPRLFSVFQSKGLLITNDQYQLIITRNKSKGRKKIYGSTADEESSDEEEEDYDDDDDDDEDYSTEKGAEVKTLKVSSLRTDLILKEALGISRKNVEENFYNNKIRINGNLLLKKSLNVQEGDEIDVIMNIEDYSANTIKVKRVKILKAILNSDNNRYIIKAWRYKSLVIDNYEGKNSWNAAEEGN